MVDRTTPLSGLFSYDLHFFATWWEIPIFGFVGIWESIVSNWYHLVNKDGILSTLMIPPYLTVVCYVAQDCCGDMKLGVSTLGRFSRFDPRPTQGIKKKTAFRYILSKLVCVSLTDANEVFSAWWRLGVCWLSLTVKIRDVSCSKQRTRNRKLNRWNLYF
jgi:hypothetical protein